MTPLTAKLPSHDIARPVADRCELAAVPSQTPSVLIASLAIHALVALALVSLPIETCVSSAFEDTWVSFDLSDPTPPAPPPAVEEPPPPLPAAAPPEPIVRHERPTAVEAPEPPAPAAPTPEPAALPSVDDVFGEPPPPAASLTGDGPSAFSVAAGEPGGVAGGTPGGHGTSLVSAIRPAPAVDSGPSEADRRRARRGYVHQVEELVRTHTRYPRAASREGLQGRVELALRIGEDGRILAIRVASTSGHGILDDAALDAAREIGRVPSPPMLAALSSTDEVRVGVVYVVR